MNARGLGEQRTCFFIRENIAKFRVGFVGVQETKKSDFTVEFLKSISGTYVFSWVWVPSVGQSGGILLGVNCEFF